MDLQKTVLLRFVASFFLLWLEYAVGQSGESPALALVAERAGLFALRSSLGLRSRDWPRKAEPCSFWVGVRCSDGRVVGLDISGLRRTRLGRINPQFAVDGLANLTLLSSFNASGFALPGAIPDWLGQRLLSLRVLDLRSASIVGSIPASVGSLQNLTSLYLSGNALTGAVPGTLGQLESLSVLDLSRNSLTGSIPFELSGLRRLVVLNLSVNFLSGGIPPSLGTLPNLTTLILANNSLLGSIPAQLGDLSLLVELNVGFNSLSGPLPADLVGLKNLQSLDVGNNVLSGPLPENFFYSLTQLQSIMLGRNSFTGALPNAIWVLPNLQLFDVSFNNFTGTFTNLPTSVSSNVTSRLFNLSHNLFYGSLPSQFSNFRVIDLSSNYFEGRNLGVSRLNASFDENCLQDTLNQRSLNDCVSFYTSRGLNFDGFGVPAPEAIQPPPPPGKKNRNLKYILGGVFGGLAFIVILVVLVVLFLRRREREGSTDQREVQTHPVSLGSGPPPSGININFSTLGESFTYEQLVKATADFGEWNLIKHGHSGDLYRGVLENGSQIVVKRIDLRRFKKDVYMVELDLFSRASHTRLVPLLGHCLEHENEKLLVYKYMLNGDLSNALYKKNNSEEEGLQSLDWITRLKIATGAAEALSYLHHECSPSFVHRDVQASSILLDDKFEVRLGSLSEVCTQEGDSHQNVISRFLRLPQTSEQGLSGSPSASCAYDVYCLGKVLLELVTGKLGISGSNDASTNEWLEDVLPYINAYEKELVTKIVDPSLIVDEDLLEEVWAMAIVAKTCLNPRPTKRPLARYILKALENPLKVVREETTSSARLRTTSSRGSWNAAFFGSWRHSSSDIVALPGSNREGGGFKPSGGGGSQGNGPGGEMSSSHKRLSKEIFPEPAAQDIERPDED
ncbi:hypothetical protein MRB53_029652 [Persea americana]|uniref:Uncharacterized protein n=1 Tax=Persea americana TaxID=3435 RepID=A0ACC2KJC0_PERAE|nr:hypothetical protein MRB53_029652 [Persea americana]